MSRKTARGPPSGRRTEASPRCQVQRADLLTGQEPVLGACRLAGPRKHLSLRKYRQQYERSSLHLRSRRFGRRVGSGLKQASAPPALAAQASPPAADPDRKNNPDILLSGHWASCARLRRAQTSSGPTGNLRKHFFGNVHYRDVLGGTRSPSATVIKCRSLMLGRS